MSTQHTSIQQNPVDSHFDLGDRVCISLRLNGEFRQVYGYVQEGYSQIPACQWPRVKKSQGEALRLPYQTPGTVTVAWKWEGLEGVVQMPTSQVRKA